MAEINIALECFGSILTLILLGSLLLHGDRSNPSTRLFVGMLLVNLVSLWADAWAWYWNGTEYVVWNWLGNFLQYLSGYVLLFLYCQYLLVRASLWTTCPWIRRSVSALCLLGIGLTVLTQFTGLFYTITPEHLCLRGEGFWLSQAIGLVALALVGGVMGLHRKGQAREERELLPAYVLLPMGILAAELLWTEITLLGIGATLTLVLVFVNVQLQRDRRLRARTRNWRRRRLPLCSAKFSPISCITFWEASSGSVKPIPRRPRRPPMSWPASSGGTWTACRARGSSPPAGSWSMCGAI